MQAIRCRISALVTLTALAALGACGSEASEEPAMDPATAEVIPAAGESRITSLLASGQPLFGIFSGDHTPEQGRQMAALREADFIFYSLEDGPFDISAMRAYIEAMNAAAAEAGVEPRPVILRIPPIEDAATAQQQVQQGIEAGAAGIVFPHVSRADQAQTSVRLLGDDLYPQGRLVDVAIVEDQEGIGNADQILPTPGLSVVIPGPGDLSRAYGGDMTAVENAIQKVLAGCKANNVTCGITAGVDDIGKRLQEGFRFFIVTDPATLTAGRQAAGRTDG